MNLENLSRTVNSRNGSVTFLGTDAEAAVRAISKLNPDAALLFVDTSATAWLLYTTADMTVIAASRFDCSSVQEPFSLYLEAPVLKQFKKGNSITVELNEGRAVKVTRTPIATAKKKSGNAVTVSLPALPPLAPLNADRIAKNIQMDDNCNELPSKAWRDVLNATKKLKIYDFNSDKKVRLCLYVVSRGDTLSVYGSDTAHIGAQIVKKSYQDFQTCITADALDVLTLLFDSEDEEDAEDDAVSLSVTKSGFIVYGRDAILFMPAPRIHESQYVATFNKVLEMSRISAECDRSSPQYNQDLPCVYADAAAFVDGVNTGKSLVNDARLGFKTQFRGTGDSNLLELTLMSDGRSVQASVSAEVYADFDFACDLRLMAETVGSLSGDVIFVEQPKFLLVLQEPVAESLYTYVYLVCKQR